MAERTEIQLQKYNRKTFIKGRFKGKYWANEDSTKTIANKEEYYNIHIYDAEVIIDKVNREEEFTEYQQELRCITPIPTPINCIYKEGNGDFKLFKLHIFDHKITNICLSNVVKELHKSFGTIEGNIYGYVQDEATKEVVVIIEDEDEPDSGSGRKKCIQNIPTGLKERKTEGKQIFERIEFFNEDCSKFWGDWKFTDTQTTATQFDYKDPWNVFYWISLILFAIGAIIAFQWATIGILFVFMLVYGFFSFFTPVKHSVFNVFFRLLFFGGICMWIFSLISAFHHRSFKRQQTVWQDDKRETTIIRKNKRKTSNNNKSHDKTIPEQNTFQDSIIFHYRIWQDYDQHNYEGPLAISTSDYRNSIIHHRILFASNITDLGQIYNQMVTNDQPMLDLVYNMLDSVKKLKINCRTVPLQM